MYGNHDHRDTSLSLIHIFGGQGQSQSTYQYNGNEQAAFNDAAAYINAGRFQDALNVLERCV